PPSPAVPAAWTRSSQDPQPLRLEAPGDVTRAWHPPYTVRIFAVTDPAFWNRQVPQARISPSWSVVRRWTPRRKAVHRWTTIHDRAMLAMGHRHAATIAGQNRSPSTTAGDPGERP